MKSPSEAPCPSPLTIGHSTRTLGEFIQILQGYDVTLVVDVRTIPRSRHNPQFNRETLPSELAAVGIGYVHMKGLGGLRRSSLEKSPNAGWKSRGFRNYADYMLTVEFDEHLQKLMELAKRERVALMCAESLPWRCHRSLIADALVVRGFQVEHIMSATASHLHALTPFAHVEGTRITYPPPCLENSGR
jgi:uncharacterized protein (DUF488 family)